MLAAIESGSAAIEPALDEMKTCNLGDESWVPKLAHAAP